MFDRLAYFDAVHRAAFKTSGICIRARDVVQTHGPCVERSARGTVGSARLGFDAKRFVEALPADAPRLQTSTLRGEQLVRVQLHLFDGGDVNVAITARPTRGVSARPINGSASRGGRVKGRSIAWRRDDLKPGIYEFSGHFQVTTDPAVVTNYVPEVIIRKADTSSAVLEYFDGRIRLGRPVPRLHTLTLLQHAAGASGMPRLNADGAYPDADAKVPNAWGLMPNYIARGAYYDPMTGLEEVTSYRIEELAPGSNGRANTGSMGWSYWSPQPGPKVEPVTEFDYEISDGLDLIGLKIGIKTAGLLRFGFYPQTPGPIYDGDGGTIGVTASLGAVHTRAKRKPARPGGRLVASWDGSFAEAWTDLGQNAAPGFEPNGSIIGGAQIIAPMRSIETGIHVFARGGDIDNRSGKHAIKGEKITLRGPWNFAAIGTAAPREANYRPRIRTDIDEIEITPIIRPDGYMLENRGKGWDVDWSAFHSVGSTQWAPNRQSDGGMVRTFLFPPGTKGRIDVFSRSGLHEVFEVAPGAWRLVANSQEMTLSRV